MQMIDVLKRLAELDSTNPNVAKPTMQSEQSLATVSNIEGEQINESVAECGPMGMSPMSSMDRPSTPATFSINASAESGSEVSSMLRDIMNLAGVKPVSDLPAFNAPKDITPVHALEPMTDAPSAGDEMGDLIGMIDKMNSDDVSVAQGDVDGDGDHDMDDHDAEKEGIIGALAGGTIGALAGGPLGALTGAAAGDSLTDPDPDEKKESSVARMADDVRGMTDKLADEGIGAGYDKATTTPDEKIKAHAYGNDQVTPKRQEPAKVNGGGNPYAESQTFESLSAHLLKAYEVFKNGQ